MEKKVRVIIKHDDNEQVKLMSREQAIAMTAFANTNASFSNTSVRILDE